MTDTGRPVLTRGEWVGLSVLVLLGAVVRVWFGLGGDGIYHPDEIYQVLEPAHQAAFGWGLRAWEFEYGARSWFLPGVLAGGLRLMEMLGGYDALRWVDAVRAGASCVHAAAGFVVYLLARQHGVGPWLAGAGAASFLFNPASIYLGFRPLSETLSAALVAFGLYWALAAQRTESDARARRWVWLGVSLLAVAVMMRLQNALFAVPLMLWWRWVERERLYVVAMRVVVVWALIFGVLDWVTWGVPFRSAGAYLRFNFLLDGSTELYGAKPLTQYFRVMWASMGWVGAVWLVAPWGAWKRAPVLLGSVVVFLGLHCLFPHKDLRFIAGTWPLLAALSVIGLDVVASNLRRWMLVKRLKPAPVAALCLVVMTAVGASGVASLTMGDLGQAENLRVAEQTSAYDHRGPVNRLLARAAEREDMCGLYLQGWIAVEVGGHTYFHRDVPFFHAFVQPESREQVNYVLARREAGVEAEVVDGEGEWLLHRVGAGGCAPAPGYHPRIFVPAEDEAEDG